jgi:hypothetical protein
MYPDYDASTSGDDLSYQAIEMELDQPDDDYEEFYVVDYAEVEMGEAVEPDYLAEDSASTGDTAAPDLSLAVDPQTYDVSNSALDSQIPDEGDVLGVLGNSSDTVSSDDTTASELESAQAQQLDDGTISSDEFAAEASLTSAEDYESTMEMLRNFTV